MRLIRFSTVVLILPALMGFPGMAAAETAPPSAGSWQIVANQSQPGSPLVEFLGSFTVNGNAVTGLHGITQQAVNRGCTAGESVTVLGNVPIRHFVNPEVPADVYEVSQPGVFFTTVDITLQGRKTKKHRARLYRSTGHLRIIFPGGSATLGGSTSYSNLTYSSAGGGTCNLEFSVNPG
jgi:hypothetical protein